MIICFTHTGPLFFSYRKMINQLGDFLSVVVLFQHWKTMEFQQASYYLARSSLTVILIAFFFCSLIKIRVVLHSLFAGALEAAHVTHTHTHTSPFCCPCLISRPCVTQYRTSTKLRRANGIRILPATPFITQQGLFLLRNACDKELLAPIQCIGFSARASS